MAEELLMAEESVKSQLKIAISYFLLYYFVIILSSQRNLILDFANCFNKFQQGEIVIKMEVDCEIRLYFGKIIIFKVQISVVFLISRNKKNIICLTHNYGRLKVLKIVGGRK